jgi:hypothetical protein
MSRLSVIVIVVAGVLGLHGSARAEDVVASNVPADVTQQAVAAAIGVAAGGSSTAGGLRVTGHYLYQMNDTDWFDGTAAFTLGSGAAGCFRDRADQIVCDHGIAAGAGGELAITVRRFLAGKDDFWPYVRAGIGLGIVRYSDDEVTGLTIPLRIGGGFRVSVTSGIAVIAEATFDAGIGFLSRDLGLEPQLGGSVTAGAEFAL